MRYFIGDVRDKNELYIATKNVDYIIHAAALNKLILQNIIQQNLLIQILLALKILLKFVLLIM